MTRRDTIISAALINAGLLVILFVCSLGIEESMEHRAAHASFVPAIQTLPESSSPNALSNTMTLSSEALSHEIALAQTMEEGREKAPQEIVVQKGDRLDSLAKSYGVSVEKLVETNQLSSTQLVVGQRLKLPSSLADQDKQEVAMLQTQALPAEALVEKAPVAAPTPKVAAAVAPKAAAKLPAKGVTAATPQYHYVQKGESPWLVAKKYGISVDSLLKLNHLDEATARRLREGDRLRVR